MKKMLWVFWGLLFLTRATQAQKSFSEGVIKYDVFVNDNAIPDGIYVITLKGGFIKRELAMNNGFNNITIYNQKTGKTLSLNIKDDTRYALEISEAELKEKNKRYQQAVFTPISLTKKIVGYACKGTEVTYQNADKVKLFYTPDLVPINETFNTMFPGLQGIPLSYETIAGPNVMRFVAALIEVKPIDSKVFAIPDTYKIVTQEELSQIK